MGSIFRETITVSGSTGGAGASTATATSGNIQGKIRAVYLAYQGSPPAGTTDVTLVEATTPGQTILSVANAATDGWFQPMAQAHLNTSGAAITNQGAEIAFNAPLTATITGANDADGVIVTIVYESP
jgi:hypothetical protein